MTPLAGNRENLWQISIHMPHTWHDHVCRYQLIYIAVISIHMPHTWHDLTSAMLCTSVVSFQSTCHIRGMTPRTPATVAQRLLFQSTCNIRGMTAVVELQGLVDLFQSTCHIRGMTHQGRIGVAQRMISIHMPHTWHDMLPAQLYNLHTDFNPHATYVA